MGLSNIPVQGEMFVQCFLSRSFLCRNFGVEGAGPCVPVLLSVTCEASLGRVFFVFVSPSVGGQQALDAFNHKYQQSLKGLGTRVPVPVQSLLLPHSDVCEALRAQEADESKQCCQT